MIEVKVLAESDDNFLSALIGMGLSFNKTTDAMKYGLSIFDGDDYSLLNDLYDKMLLRAKKLAFLGKGHSEFLRAIHLDLIVRASIDFWEQMAMYTTTVVFQGSSSIRTMHLNYMILQDIYKQNHNKTLQIFCGQIIKQINHPYFLDKDYK